MASVVVKILSCLKEGGHCSEAIFWGDLMLIRWLCFGFIALISTNIGGGYKNGHCLFLHYSA